MEFLQEAYAWWCGAETWIRIATFVLAWWTVGLPFGLLTRLVVGGDKKSAAKSRGRRAMGFAGDTAVVSVLGVLTVVSFVLAVLAKLGDWRKRRRERVAKARAEKAGADG